MHWQRICTTYLCLSLINTGSVVAVNRANRILQKHRHGQVMLFRGLLQYVLPFKGYQRNSNALIKHQRPSEPRHSHSSVLTQVQRHNTIHVFEMRVSKELAFSQHLFVHRVKKINVKLQIKESASECLTDFIPSYGVVFVVYPTTQHTRCMLFQLKAKHPRLHFLKQSSYGALHLFENPVPFITILNWTGNKISRQLSKTKFLTSGILILSTTATKQVLRRRAPLNWLTQQSVPEQTTLGGSIMTWNRSLPWSGEAFIREGSSTTWHKHHISSKQNVQGCEQLQHRLCHHQFNTQSHHRNTHRPEQTVKHSTSTFC